MSSVSHICFVEFPEDITAFSPFSETRIISDIRGGVWSLSELCQENYAVSVWTDRETQAQLFGHKRFDIQDDTETLFLNAAFVPDPRALSQLIDIAIKHPDNSIFSSDTWLGYFAKEPKTPSKDSFFKSPRQQLDGDITNFQYSYEVVQHFSQIFPQQLDMLMQNTFYQEVTEQVFTGENVSLHPTVITDTHAGPIVLSDHVTISPYSILTGPLFAGEHATINSHSHISKSTIGRWSKVGGEVNSTIFGDYSNKQHHGFLGHSVVGSWVNIGAGASNSNLKNTYGTVRLHYHDGTVDTGQQFLGTLIGDMAKVAINTSLYTGKMIGAGAHAQGEILSNISPFQMTHLSGDTLIYEASAQKTQRRMMQRRKQSDESIKRWQAAIAEVYQTSSTI